MNRDVPFAYICRNLEENINSDQVRSDFQETFRLKSSEVFFDDQRVWCYVEQDKLVRIRDEGQNVPEVLLDCEILWM